MPHFKTISSIALAALLLSPPALPCGNLFAPAAGQAGTTAVAAADSNISGWATGFSSYVPGSDVDVQFQTPGKALNEAGDSDGLGEGFVFDIVSLGRGGQITLTFDTPISNGPGCDFAIFENSFSDGFLELAWVEVSSNGSDFFRFAGASLTSSAVGPFASTMDPTHIEGFAGKYRGGYGTPFDLDNIADAPLLDKNAITHIRIIDIVGDGNTLDSTIAQNPIYDPYPTSGSAGFDLDAVAVMNTASAVNVPVPPFFIFTLAMLLAVVASATSNKTSLHKTH